MQKLKVHNIHVKKQRLMNFIGSRTYTFFVFSEYICYLYVKNVFCKIIPFNCKGVIGLTRVLCNWITTIDIWFVKEFN